MFAAGISAKRVAVMRAHRHWQWHLDEVCVKFNGVTHSLSPAFSGRLIHRINRCPASPWAKAVAMKADTTRSPLLPAWSSRAAMTRHSGQWRAKAVVRVGRKVLHDALRGACAHRRPLHPRKAAETPNHDPGRKARQGRADGAFAKAGRNGQTARPTRPQMDAGSRLIRTDTSGCPGNIPASPETDRSDRHMPPIPFFRRNPLKSRAVG